ncbi:hypothetical protein ABW21_db0208892 [Orbilia brochopaga]|nr:hypothetical protein ABW21_db0208892 [Drechslerella brochopaga]
MEPITALVGEFGAGILVTLVVVLFAMSLSRAIFGDGSLRSGHSGLRKTEREILQEMWLREEAGLWEWLEDRARVDQVLSFDERVSARYGKEAGGMREAVRVQAQEARMDPRLVERQVDEAIRVTEERLGVLKRVNEEKKAARRSGCGCGKGEGGCGCGKGKACTCKTCNCGAKQQEPVAPGT